MYICMYQQDWLQKNLLGGAKSCQNESFQSVGGTELTVTVNEALQFNYNDFPKFVGGKPRREKYPYPCKCTPDQCILLFFQK